MTVFRAQITADGGLNLGSDFNRTRFKEFCKGHVGGWLRIEHQPPVRSMSQHRFYWVYLDAIAHETGHTPEELHAWVKATFLPKKFATVLGKDVELAPTTTTLSTHKALPWLPTLPNSYEPQTQQHAARQNIGRP